jgi:hypothetical protein
MERAERTHLRERPDMPRTKVEARTRFRSPTPDKPPITYKNRITQLVYWQASAALDVCVDTAVTRSSDSAEPA